MFDDFTHLIYTNIVSIWLFYHEIVKGLREKRTSTVGKGRYFRLQFSFAFSNLFSVRHVAGTGNLTSVNRVSDDYVESVFGRSGTKTPCTGLKSATDTFR
jgi:hypothetical protein